MARRAFSRRLVTSATRRSRWQLAGAASRPDRSQRPRARKRRRAVRQARRRSSHLRPHRAPLPSRPPRRPRAPQARSRRRSRFGASTGRPGLAGPSEVRSSCRCAHRRRSSSAAIASTRFSTTTAARGVASFPAGPLAGLSLVSSPPAREPAEAARPGDPVCGAPRPARSRSARTGRAPSTAADSRAKAIESSPAAGSEPALRRASSAGRTRPWPTWRVARRPRGG